MKLRWPVYVVLAIILAGSCALAALLGQSGLWADLAAIPGVGALLGALFQLTRDAAEHERKRALRHEQRVFDIGVTSHMADVAFDRHVAFCEEYVSQLNVTVERLLVEGESAVALDLANKLHAIRRKHIVWLTPELDKQLEPIDLALRKVGATARLHSQYPGIAAQSGRLDEMFNLFASIVGIKGVSDTTDKEIAVDTVIGRVRDMLGVPQLLALRKGLLALHRLDGPEAGKAVKQ